MVMNDKVILMILTNEVHKIKINEINNKNSTKDNNLLGNYNRYC